MPFYALATRQLLKQELRAWWDTLCKEGVRYGYDANSVKTYLLVKPDLLAEAHRLFQRNGDTDRD